MKLASLNHGRDGQLILVSRDHQSAMFVHDIAPTLQFALDNWHLVEQELQHQYELLNAGKAEIAFKFNPLDCHSPLPRAFQWADGSAYVNHIELVRKARGAEMPPSFWVNPLVYQGMSDGFLPPHGDIEMRNPEWGWDFEAELAIITDDVPIAVTADDAAQHIKLVMLVNDISLRNLIPDELAKGFGFFQSKPTSSFSPIAVTPDELGEHWSEGKLHLEMQVTLNGEHFGHPNAGQDMTFSFPQLIAHIAKSRALGAGTIIGSGTISNRDSSVGSCCLAEKRMLEKITHGEITTPFLQPGDHLSITMTPPDGAPLFGEINQRVIACEPVSQTPPHQIKR
ncbi:fumarylacetoacetate hydrolase family protein [Thaumasiovibrio subtropicus]|uniref:fumarylacetoacetate hydrolase family protein n=1 Tax=Thaumasiovibrio subtropicus TaxID=1891207 RepID=UPI000B34B6C2|nr:fumarylacetoacetate hydrolase family protein [Thaumasiovibrio subtropicus]